MHSRSAIQSSLIPVLLAVLPLPAAAQQAQQPPPRDGLSDLIRSGIEAFGGNQRDGQVSLQQVTANWNEAAREAARRMFEKYGPPQEVTMHRLVWHDNRPWKSTAVINQEVQHNFPAPHTDVLIQTIAIDVPVEKYSELAQFDGSVTVNRTAGELSAHCDREENNLIALNLANDVINGTLSVAQARQRMGELVEAVQRGQRPSYASAIQFNLPVSNRTGDPDGRGSSREWQRIGW